MEIVFVDDGGGFGRKLSPFLQRTGDVFSNQNCFEIYLVATRFRRGIAAKS